MLPSNFEKVKNFMNIAGQNTLSKDLSDEKLVKFRMSLIEEELSELKTALDAKDRVETVDAIADLLYVIYGMAASFDIDADKAFNIVHRSNMSKFCTTKNEAINTVKWYKEEYISGRLSYDSPTYKQVNDYWVVYNQNTGKILKSIFYTPANLTDESLSL